MDKPTTTLSPQDRVILFCVATGIVHGSVGITDHAMQSMAIRGFIAHDRESGAYTLTDSGRATLTAMLEYAGRDISQLQRQRASLAGAGARAASLSGHDALLASSRPSGLLTKLIVIRPSASYLTRRAMILSITSSTSSIRGHASAQPLP